MKRAYVFGFLLALSSMPLQAQTPAFIAQTKTCASIGAKGVGLAISALTGVLFAATSVGALSEIHTEYGNDKNLARARRMQRTYPGIVVDQSRFNAEFVGQKIAECAIAAALCYGTYRCACWCYQSIQRDIEFLKDLSNLYPKLS